MNKKCCNIFHKTSEITTSAVGLKTAKPGLWHQKKRAQVALEVFAARENRCKSVGNARANALPQW